VFLRSLAFMSARLGYQANRNPKTPGEPISKKMSRFFALLPLVFITACQAPGQWSAKVDPAKAPPESPALAEPDKPAESAPPAETPKPSDTPKPAEVPVVPEITKRVLIDKTTQTLTAFEGDQLFLKTNVSTGKWDGSTPNGQFKAEAKFRMHYSKKYHGAAMPFSIWVKNNCFIHGFKSVPPYPASHGCIRMPLSKDNPARKLFEWMEVGTPIEIVGKWPE